MECTTGYFCVSGAATATPTDYDTSLTCDCPLPSNITGGQCQPGDYCPQGSVEPTPCEEGYYCETPGLATYTGGLLFFYGFI